MAEWTIPYDLTISSPGKPTERVQGNIQVFQQEETAENGA